MDHTASISNNPKVRTVRVFSQMAETYDQGGPAYFSRFGQRLVDIANVSVGARVLDVATGRGAVLFPAAEAVGDTGTVVGIDLTETMVRLTSAELASREISNAEVRVGDAEELTFPDASFDIVLCGFGVMFFPQLNRAMAEFRRVLASGGTLGVSTYATIPPTPAIGPVMRAYQETSRNPLTQDLATVDELEALLDGNGFTNVNVHEETLDVVYADADEYWAWSMGLLTGVWFRAQTPEIQARFEADVRVHLATIQQPDGIHEFVTALIATGTS